MPATQAQHFVVTMSPKQELSSRWREIIFLGDFFRLPQIRPLTTTKAEMYWHYFAESFFHLCRLPASEGTKLPVRFVQHNELAREKVRHFYTHNIKESTEPDEKAFLCLCRQGITQEACAFAKRYIFPSSHENILVVGYNLSPFTLSVLTTCGLDWLNAHLHPASFLPDLRFSFSTNVAQIAKNLAMNSLDDREIQRFADWQKARYAPNAFLNYLPENALLILAQDWMDPLPLTVDNQIDTFSAHRQTLQELAGKHSVILAYVNHSGPYAPGPGLAEQDQVFLDKELNAVLLPVAHIYLKNTIMLFSHPSISTVVGLNSKRLAEAHWFGKKIVQLTPSPVSFSLGDLSSSDAQLAYTPEKSCFSAHFWASLVASPKGSQIDAYSQFESQHLPNVRLIFRGGGSDFDDTASSSLSAGLARAHKDIALARQDLLMHELRHILEEIKPAAPLQKITVSQKDYALFCTGNEKYLLPAIVALESTRRRTGQADAFYVTDASRLSDKGQSLLHKYNIKLLHSGEGNNFTIKHLHTTSEAYVQLFVPEMLGDLGYSYSLGLHADVLCVQPFNPKNVFDHTHFIALTGANPAARCYSVTDNHSTIEKNLGLSPCRWFYPLNNPGVFFAKNAALAEINFSRQCTKAYEKCGPEFFLCNEETLINLFCILDEEFCYSVDERFNLFNGSLSSGKTPFFLHYLNSNKPWLFTSCEVRSSDWMTPLTTLFSIWHREAKFILDEDDYNACLATSGV